MKTAIIFDLDGTLLDTLQDLADSVNHVLCARGCPQRSPDQIRAFVGNGAARLMELALPEGYEDFDGAFADFRAHYGANCRRKTASYPGVEEMLRGLSRHCAVAIVSNKPDFAVKSLCADFFPGIPAWGEAPDCPRKPAPDMLYRAMKALGAEKCLYVGDSEVDVTTAKNAGAICLSVLWGFRDREVLEKAGATHFCACAGELTGAVAKILGENHG